LQEKPGLVGTPAAARIHGSDQHEARGIGHAVVGARDRDLAALERLAQRIERLRRKLRQFVEEEHAVMRERDLARPRAQPAADQRRHAGGMVRGAERPAVGKRAPFDLAGHRRDHGDFEQLLRHERRQDGGEPRRQHRLARAGRADHEEVMPAGGGDLERALRALLPLDVLEVELRAVEFADLRLRAREHLRAAEMIGELDERGGGISISGLAHAASGPQAAGQMRPSPRALAPIAAGSTPATAAIEPSSPSSPSTVKPESASAGMAPIAAIRPSAMGRS
jgi:hypothetical protein